MYFLLNDVVLEVDQRQLMHPLDAERFSSLSLDYIAQLGKEMFAEDPFAHRTNPERARRLAYLINLKMPSINAAHFFVTSTGGDPAGVETDFKSINAMALGLMLDQQSQGSLDARKVDDAVWHRLAA
ncbi:MAG: hypothetical protein ACXU8U_02400 [Asticcacaulis sp.]